MIQAQPNFAHSGKHVLRIAPFHPIACRRLSRQFVHTREQLSSRRVVSRRHECIAQVQLAVGDNFRIGVLPRLPQTALIELDGAVEVAAFRIQPAQAVQKPVAKELIAQLVGKRETLRLDD